MDYKSLGIKELRAEAVKKGMDAAIAKATKKKELLAFLTSEMPLRAAAPAAVPKNALSLFSGAGGDTCGLESVGWNVTHFSEFNKPAIATHQAAYPSSKLLTDPDGSTDIKNVSDASFTALRGDVDLIFAGHPCFPENTPVYTDHGWMYIQDVRTTDLVLTHTGAFQRVTQLMRNEYKGNLICIAATFHAHSIKSTPAHPFYARIKGGPPKWVAAADLTYEHQLATLRRTLPADEETIRIHGGEYDGIYVWFNIRSIGAITHEVGLTVYNLEVETDNSYIVKDVIVHNCQGFSHAGKKRADDPRNELVHEFVRAAEHVQPTWIIGENVKGLLSRRGVYPANTAPRPVIEIIKDLFEAKGYKITYRVIDATEVGVPQLRKRLIYVGHKGDTYPHLPWEMLPTPAEKPTIRALLTSTLEGAIELPALYRPATQPPRFWIATTETAPTGTPHPNLVRLVGGFRNLSTKEKTELGHSKTEKVPHVEPEGLISFGVRKSSYHGQVLDPDMPCKTIICAYNQCPRLFVGLHNAATGKYWIRCLTPAECGAIQGFPADYAWRGSAKDRITQIGNAVPPPLAAAVGRLLSHAKFETTPQVITHGVDAVDDSESEDE
jgi:DNA (cytosine-5)-methyltransferase 1